MVFVVPNRLCLVYFTRSRRIVAEGIAILSLSDSVQFDQVASVETLFELAQLLMPDDQVLGPLLGPDSCLWPCYGFWVLALPHLKKVVED